MNEDFKLYGLERPIDVASAVALALQWFKKSYILSIEINDGGDLKRIHFPSIGKLRRHGGDLRSSTLTTSFDGMTIKYTLSRDGSVKFFNQWANPKFRHFKKLLMETINPDKESSVCGPEALIAEIKLALIDTFSLPVEYGSARDRNTGGRVHIFYVINHGGSPLEIMDLDKRLVDFSTERQEQLLLLGGRIIFRATA